MIWGENPLFSETSIFKDLHPLHRPSVNRLTPSPRLLRSIGSSLRPICHKGLPGVHHNEQPQEQDFPHLRFFVFFIENQWFLARHGRKKFDTIFWVVLRGNFIYIWSQENSTKPKKLVVSMCAVVSLSTQCLFLDYLVLTVWWAMIKWDARQLG